MALNMKDSSRKFLEENLPAALEADSPRDVLIQLYDLIDEKGFAPPRYEEYNDFGRTAQKVYDDIYLNNQ